jgi:hypothetical protein
MTALYLMDTACVPACSVFGPYSYFSEQYDSLSAISSIGHSSYQAMALTFRKLYSHGVLFDANYTLSQSKDMASWVERGSAFVNFDNGGYSGFLVNSFDPESNYGISDFDVRHQVNVSWLTELPFGRGKPFGSNVGGLSGALVSDWSVAGIWRATSGFPFNVYNCRSCWATNWNSQGNAMLVDPGRLPETKTTRDAVDGRPSPFADPEAALSFFRRALPGEVGIRNVLRGDGVFHDRFEHRQGSAIGHRRSPPPLPLGHLQPHEHAPVRRRSADDVPRPRGVRALQRHPGHLRRPGRALHAVLGRVHLLTPLPGSQTA